MAHELGKRRRAQAAPLKVQWTAASLDDLVQLRAFIADDSPRAARTVARRILEAVDKLRATPGIGRPGRIPETRELLVPRTPYFVAYRVTRSLEILRVLHSARKWPPGL